MSPNDREMIRMYAEPVLPVLPELARSAASRGSSS